MPPLYVTEHGALVRHADQRLIVSKDGATLASVPLAQVDAVVLAANAIVGPATAKLLLYRGVDTVFLTASGAYCGRLTGPFTRNGLLRQAQHAAAGDAVFALGVARACVAGKLRNTRTLLMRYQRDLAEPALGGAIDQLDAQLPAVDAAASIGALMGVEGAAGAAYFGVFGRLLKRDWGFVKRIRRPPTDPVNAILGFGYALLARAIEAAIQTVGFDPYVGFLHQPVYGRPSLALDLMEEFRPIVADSVALRCLNTGLITPAEFARAEDTDRPIQLTPAGIKRYVAEFEARLNTEFQHPESGERVTYRRCFDLQAQRLAAAVRTAGRGGAYRPLLTR